MLKITLNSFIILIIGAGFSSCVSNEVKTRGHAEKLCDCMQEIGLNDSLNSSDMSDHRKMRLLERNAEQSLPSCILPTLKEMQADMVEMGKSEKKEYTKAFLKNVIDTECSDLVLDNVPLDMIGVLIKEIEQAAEYSERKMNEDLATEMVEELMPD